jgi:hypothetical protein
MRVYVLFYSSMNHMPEESAPNVYTVGIYSTEKLALQAMKDYVEHNNPDQDDCRNQDDLLDSEVGSSAPEEHGHWFTVQALELDVMPSTRGIFASVSTISGKVFDCQTKEFAVSVVESLMGL